MRIIESVFFGYRKCLSSNDMYSTQYVCAWYIWCEAEILGKPSEQVDRDSQQSIHLAKALHTLLRIGKYKFKHLIWTVCMIDQILSQILIIKSLMLTFAIHKYTGEYYVFEIKWNIDVNVLKSQVIFNAIARNGGILQNVHLTLRTANETSIRMVQEYKYEMWFFY